MGKRAAGGVWAVHPFYATLRTLLITRAVKE